MHHFTFHLQILSYPVILDVFTSRGIFLKSLCLWLSWFRDCINPVLVLPAQGSNQGYLLACKVGLYVGLTTLPPSYAVFLEILRASTTWSPKGLPRPVMG